MSFGVLYQIRDVVSPAGEAARLMYDGARLPRDVFKRLRLADDVLREAEVAAAQLHERSAATIEARKREAHVQGYSQGHAQAIGAVLGTLEIERRLRELLAHRLADIVEHGLRGLLGELGDSQALRGRLLHLVRTATVRTAGAASPGRIDGVDAGSSPATLYVCPQQFAEVQGIVADWGSGSDSGPGPGPCSGPGPGSGSGSGPDSGLAILHVVIDRQRKPDSLLLETRLGFIESNLELTLQEARNLVQHALSRALQVPEAVA